MSVKILLKAISKNPCFKPQAVSPKDKEKLKRYLQGSIFNLINNSGIKQGGCIS